jgi:hypothetical protein
MAATHSKTDQETQESKAKQPASQPESSTTKKRILEQRTFTPKWQTKKAT